MYFLNKCSKLIQRNSFLFFKSKRTLTTEGDVSKINDTNVETDLARQLKMLIQLRGPITVSDYIKECLGNPKFGYYMKQDVFGSKGDFITSPEISQMFGELIGVWFLNEWFILKRLYGVDLPRTVQLTELGPGRGTLMSDLLKVWSKNKEAASDLNIYMIESSPFMRRTQIKNLCNLELEPTLREAYKSKYSENIKITWLSDLGELPRKDAPNFFVANEFFDALPIQKFQKTENGYKEILVDHNSQTNKLEFKLSKRDTIGSNIVLKLNPEYHKHDHIEVSVESARIIEAISKRLNDSNGSMLVIDYGHNGECKDTFRAFKSHKLVDVFQSPGDCDLTADVDFLFLKHIALKSKMTCYGPVTQEDFLKRMQIAQRFQILLKSCKSEKERTKLSSDLKMLIEPDKMGNRFKVFSFRKFDLKQAPPGFE